MNNIYSILKKIVPLELKILLKDNIFTKGRFEKIHNMCQLQLFEYALNSVDKSLKDFHFILDFGCGPARLTRYLPKIFPNAKIYGCEISNKIIKKNIRQYPDINFKLTNKLPPIDYEDNSFDLIFTYSVLNHFDENELKKWLLELSKKLKNGGMMVHTLHGIKTFKILELFAPESIKKYNIDINDEFYNKKNFFHFAKQTDDYGISIMSKDYVIEKWPLYSGLKFKKYLEGIVQSCSEGCHDIVILEK